MEGLCCNNRISQNPETSFALVRRYLRWMNHATPRQHITARRAGGGSARSTPRTKHGIIALSAKVMRVARDKRPGCPQCGNAIFKPSERIWGGDKSAHTVECGNRGSLQGEKWIVPVDDCRLTLQRGDGDFGVRRVGPLSFECELTLDGCRSVVSLLEQFCNSKNKRFQWLIKRGRIYFLISLDGQWGRRDTS